MITPEQQAKYDKILDRMITNCDQALVIAKGVVAKNILQAAKDLEKSGAPLTSICHMIIQRVEQSDQLSTSKPYVYEVLPDKYRDPAQRAAAMAKYKDRGEIAAEMAENDAGYGKPSQQREKTALN